MAYGPPLHYIQTECLQCSGGDACAMWCGGKEERSARKSPDMVIYGATSLLSQRARVQPTRELEDRSRVAATETSKLARVSGTRARWDRSGVAPYITMSGDFRALLSSFPPHHIVYRVWHVPYYSYTLVIKLRSTVRVKIKKYRS